MLYIRTLLNHKFSTSSSSTSLQFIFIFVFFRSFNTVKIMGRAKLAIKKLESLEARQLKYAKRKNGIIKKASELSVLCNTDVGLIMFSPTGRLTSFSRNGRVEDVFIRYLRESDQTEGGANMENKERLMKSLMHLKCEAQIMELLAEKEALDEEFESLNQQLGVVQDVVRFYNSGLSQAAGSEKSITNALQRVRQLKGMFLGNGNSDQKAKANEIQDGEIVDADPMIKESLESNPILQRDQPKEGNLQETRSSMMGPHLSINFINERSNWNLSGNRLPFKEIVDHEPFNASPDEQQDIDSESSDVTVED